MAAPHWETRQLESIVAAILAANGAPANEAAAVERYRKVLRALRSKPDYAAAHGVLVDSAGKVSP